MEQNDSLADGYGRTKDSSSWPWWYRQKARIALAGCEKSFGPASSTSEVATTASVQSDESIAAFARSKSFRASALCQAAR